MEPEEPVVLTEEELKCEGLYLEMLGRFITKTEDKIAVREAHEINVKNWWTSINAEFGIEVPEWVAKDDFGLQEFEEEEAMAEEKEDMGEAEHTGEEGSESTEPHAPVDPVYNEEAPTSDEEKP